MNTYKRFLALIATAIICTAFFPLGAMKNKKQTERRKIEYLNRYPDPTTRPFLLAISNLTTNPQNSKTRSFVLEKISSMPIFILENSLFKLENKTPNLSSFIKKGIENKRKREKTADKKMVKKKKTNNEQKTCCPICNKEGNGSFTTLNCDEKISHTFHKSCLKNWVKEIKKNEYKKTFFTCPSCRKPYQMETILTTEEIKAFERIGSLIEKASKGDVEAVKEILTHNDIANNEDLGKILINNAQNNRLNIVTLFLTNKTIMEKIGPSNISIAFTKSFERACIKTCLAFVNNKKLFNEISYDQPIKEILIAINEGNYDNFKQMIEKLIKDKSISKKLFQNIFVFSTCSCSPEIRMHYLKDNISFFLNSLYNLDLESITAYALEKGYQDVIQKIFTQNNNHFFIQSNETYLQDLLTNASRNGWLDVIKYFLTLYEDISEKVSFNIIFYTAAENGSLNIIKHFFNPENEGLLNKINPNKPKNLAHALICTIENGHLNIVQEFFKLENRDHLESINKFDLGEALKCAVINDKIEIIHIFLDPSNKEILEMIGILYLSWAIECASKNGYIDTIKAFLNNEIIMSKLKPENFEEALNGAKTDEIKNVINEHIKNQQKLAISNNK
jgi:hypothetical protein